MKETYFDEDDMSAFVKSSHTASDGDKVEVEIDEPTYLASNKVVHLLSPTIQITRDLMFGFVGKGIEIFNKLKEEEGSIDKELSNVIETILLALDYLTSHSLRDVIFKDEHRIHLSDILGDCFKDMKTHSFREASDRIMVRESEMFKGEDDKYYAYHGITEKSYRIHAIQFYRNSDLYTYFKAVIASIKNLKLTNGCQRKSYDDYIAGMRDNELHTDTIFWINHLSKVLLWTLNCYSGRINKLEPFDRLEITIKLGLN